MDANPIDELRAIIDELNEAALYELLEAAQRVRDFYRETVPYQPDPIVELPPRKAKVLPVTTRIDFPFDEDAF